MGAFRNALTALAGLTVTGVLHNYDVDTLPPKQVYRAQLPCLLVLPVEIDRRVTREGSEGLGDIVFPNQGKTVIYAVNHVLLAAETSLEAHRAVPLLADLVDNYFAALKSNLTLGETLLEATQVRVEAAVIKYGENHYWGCRMRHLWNIEI